MSPYLDLNPQLTETQQTLKQEIHRFAAEIARPASIELDTLADPQAVIKPARRCGRCTASTTSWSAT